MTRNRRCAPLEERFWAYVDKETTPDGCWEWKGPTQHRKRVNYGVISRGRRGEGSVLAHRLAVEIETGSPVETGIEVRHSCDNGICVRFSHLVLGSHAENMADMGMRGRSGMLKLTTLQVQEIRSYSYHKHLNSELAKMLNVSYHTIWSIRKKADRRKYA